MFTAPPQPNPTEPNPTGLVIICSITGWKFCTQVYPVRIWTPNWFWIPKFFRPTFFNLHIWKQSFFWPKIFWDPNFLSDQYFFLGPNICTPNYSSNPKIPLRLFFDPSSFRMYNIFWPQFFLDIFWDLETVDFH